MVAESRPDAIVMDVRMPRMDGLTALAELKADPDTRDIPVVMLSASLPDQKEALDRGARFFLRKPYGGQALIEAVRSSLPQECPA